MAAETNPMAERERQRNPHRGRYPSFPRLPRQVEAEIVSVTAPMLGAGHAYLDMTFEA